MTLDIGCALPAAGLNDVRIKRPLHQNSNLTGLADHLARRGFERPDELRPMILRFSSGSLTPDSADRNCSDTSTTLRSTPVAAT
jgi:hypothetical protein